MGKKRLIIVCILTLAVVSLLNRYYSHNYVDISFNAYGNRLVEFQVFYSKQKGFEFSENKSVKKALNLIEENEFLVTLPTNKIGAIRLDFGSNPGIVKISNIVIKGSKEFAIKPNKQMETNQLDSFTIDSNSFEITSSNDDPFIILSNNIKIRGKTSINYQVLIIIITISFMFFYALVKYLSKFKILENNSRIDIVFLCFIAMLLFVPMSSLDKSANSKTEMRALAKYESLFINGRINQNYGKNFEKWFNDRFFGRGLVIDLYEKLTSIISAERGNDNVLVGKEGWLFYKGNNSINNFQNIDLFDENELKQITEYLQNINDWCEANNKKFYFMIAPDKNKIYGEFYTMAKKFNPDSQSRAQQLINHLKENSTVKFVYNYDILHKNKSGELLYWKTDTHWNELGAYYGYTDLMNMIKQDFDIEHITYTETTKAVMANAKDQDLYKMYSKGAKLDDYEYEIPVIKQDYTCNIYKWADDVHCHNENGKYHIFMLRDSFASSLFPYLAATFYELDAHFKNKFVPQDINDNVDIVVLESVERLLPSLLNNKF